MNGTGHSNAHFGVGRFYGLAAPLVVSRAGLAAMSIADAIMVSRYSAGEYAALALGDALVGRLLDVFIACFFGWLALTPRLWSSGDRAHAARLWRTALRLSAVLGAIAVGVGFAGREIWVALGQDAVLTEKAAPFMRVLAGGVFPALAAIASAIYLEGTGRPLVVAAAVVAGNAINVGLNWLWIGGHGGFPAMGAVGSAWSTTVVRWILAVVLVSIAYRASRHEASESRSTDWTLIRADAARLAWTASASTAAMVVLGSFVTVYAGWLGVLPLAIFSAALSMTGPIALVAMGLADAAGITVGIAAGAGKPPHATAWATLRWAALPMGALTVLFLVARHWLAAAYSREPGVQFALAALLPVAILIVMADTAGLVMNASLRALKESRWPLSIEVASMVLLTLLAKALAFGQSDVGVAAQGVTGLVLAMLMVAALRAACLAGRLWWCQRAAGHAAFQQEAG